MLRLLELSYFIDSPFGESFLRFWPILIIVKHNCTYSERWAATVQHPEAAVRAGGALRKPGPQWWHEGGDEQWPLSPGI